MAGFPAFSAAILHRSPSSLGAQPRSDGRKFGNNRRGYCYATRNSAPGISPASGSLSHEIDDCAFRNLKLQFGSEDSGDIPIRQPTPAQLTYQFAARFQAGAPRFLVHLGQNISKFVFHMPQNCINMHRTEAGQVPDKTRKATGQTTRDAGRPNLSRRLLGMVSMSKFNLPKLQIVANRSICCRRPIRPSGRRACCDQFQTVAICRKTQVECAPKMRQLEIRHFSSKGGTKVSKDKPGKSKKGGTPQRESSVIRSG